VGTTAEREPSGGRQGVPFSGVAGTDRRLDGAESGQRGTPGPTSRSIRELRPRPTAACSTFVSPAMGSTRDLRPQRRRRAGRWSAHGGDLRPDPRDQPQDAKRTTGIAQVRPSASAGREGGVERLWWQDGKGSNVPLPIAHGTAVSRRVPTRGGASPPEGLRPGHRSPDHANADTAAGAAPTGQVELSLSTVDLETPEQMPGDDMVERRRRDGWMGAPRNPSSCATARPASDCS
jgi:hypothetical protein